MQIPRTPVLRVLVLTVLCGACSIGKGKEDAVKAVDRFHAQYARQQFDSIYAAADKDLKQTTTQAEFVRFMSAVHRKLGPIEETKSVGWNVQRQTNGSFVLLNYETEFARGPGTESFTWRIREGVPRLHTYNVNSPALVVDEDPSPDSATAVASRNRRAAEDGNSRSHTESAESTESGPQ